MDIKQGTTICIIGKREPGKTGLLARMLAEHPEFKVRLVKEGALVQMDEPRDTSTRETNFPAFPDESHNQSS